MSEPPKEIVRRLRGVLFGGETNGEKATDGLNENDNRLLSLLRHIEVEILPLRDLERYTINRRIPPSNRKQAELFRLLRYKVGGEARIKGTLTAEKLRSELSEIDVEIVAQPSTEELREQVRAFDAGLKSYKNSFGATGIHLERPITAKIIQWATEATFENNFAVLLDQAGMGKTVVAQDILLGLENAGLAVLAIKAEAGFIRSRANCSGSQLLARGQPNGLSAGSAQLFDFCHELPTRQQPIRFPSA